MHPILVTLVPKNGRCPKKCYFVKLMYCLLHNIKLQYLGNHFRYLKNSWIRTPICGGALEISFSELFMKMNGLGSIEFGKRDLSSVSRIL